MDDYNDSVFNIIIQHLVIVGDTEFIIQAAQSFLIQFVGIYKLELILTRNYIK